MDYQKDESAKWAQVVHKATDEFEKTMETVLTGNAGRGFVSPTGPSLASILKSSHGAQNALTEENAKIYAEQRAVIYRVEEFDLKLTVEINKMDLEFYRSEILNDIAIEQATQESNLEEWRADIQRINTEINKREVKLIRAKADVEHELNSYKMSQLKTEYQTLTPESELIEAKIVTASMKLKILDSLWKVITAEQLTVVSEQRRSKALALLVESKERLAILQQEMVPLYESKADARIVLADATKEEAQYREEIEKLGYQKKILEDTTQGVEHQIREAENDYEYAKELLTKATSTTALLREQSSRLLQEYRNEVDSSLLEREHALKKLGIDLNLSVEYQRRKMAATADVSMLNYQKTLATNEIEDRVANISDVGSSDATTVSASASQTYSTAGSRIVTQIIKKGSYS